MVLIITVLFGLLPQNRSILPLRLVQEEIEALLVTVSSSSDLWSLHWEITWRDE